jgi:hypothetical protein
MTNKTKSSRKTNNRKKGYLTPTYRPIGKHIYMTSNPRGNRYRVRMSINGVKYDEYFTNKSMALKYRKELYGPRTK